jgi:hypothetical protein
VRRPTALSGIIDSKADTTAFLPITDGKVHDVKAAPRVPIEDERFFVVVRGYLVFTWRFSIHQAHAFFLTWTGRFLSDRSLHPVRYSRPHTRVRRDTELADSPFACDPTGTAHVARISPLEIPFERCLQRSCLAHMRRH